MKTNIFCFLQECIPKYKKFIEEHEKFDVEYDKFLSKIHSWKSQLSSEQPTDVDSLKVLNYCNIFCISF